MRGFAVVRDSARTAAPSPSRRRRPASGAPPCRSRLAEDLDRRDVVRAPRWLFAPAARLAPTAAAPSTQHLRGRGASRTGSRGAPIATPQRAMPHDGSFCATSVKRLDRSRPTRNGAGATRAGSAPRWTAGLQVLAKLTWPSFSWPACCWATAGAAATEPCEDDGGEGRRSDVRIGITTSVALRLTLSEPRIITPGRARAAGQRGQADPRRHRGGAGEAMRAGVSSATIRRSPSTASATGPRRGPPANGSTAPSAADPGDSPSEVSRARTASFAPPATTCSGPASAARAGRSFRPAAGWSITPLLALATRIAATGRRRGCCTATGATFRRRRAGGGKIDARVLQVPRDRRGPRRRGTSGPPAPGTDSPGSSRSRRGSRRGRPRRRRARKWSRTSRRPCASNTRPGRRPAPLPPRARSLTLPVRRHAEEMVAARLPRRRARRIRDAARGCPPRRARWPRRRERRSPGSWLASIGSRPVERDPDEDTSAAIGATGRARVEDPHPVGWVDSRSCGRRRPRATTSAR